MHLRKHLLVIRLSAMGDVAATVPILSALTQQYPDVQVTVLTKEFYGPIFSQLINVNVYIADIGGRHKGVFGLWRLFKELKAMNIDAVADLHNVLRSNILKGYFKLGGFQFAQINKGRAQKKSLTASKNKIFKPLKTTHQRYADVFAAMGFPLILEDIQFLSKRQLTEKTKILIDSKKESVIGIAPFAAFKGKIYPIDLMEKVISNLSTANKILLFGGGKKEQNQLEIWETQFPNVISIPGKIAFAEELDLISHLDVMLAMDSGNGHLASLFGIPTVTLWGVTHPFAGFYPFGQPKDNALLADRTEYPLIPTSIYGNKTPDGYNDVMRTITPKEIIAKIEYIIKKRQT